MQTGNGIDAAAVYQLLSEMDTRLRGVEGKLNELVGVVNEHTKRFDEVAEVLGDHGRKLDDLNEGLGTLRVTVSQYHHSVIGQGLLLNDLEERVRRVERHLHLDTADD